MTKVLAFLQNAWFPKDTRLDYITKYLNDDVFRRRVLARSWSGRRLIYAFGEEMFSKIIWDNVSIEVGPYARYKGKPTLEYVKHVLKRHNPDLILTFSGMAEGTIQLFIDQGLVKCPVMTGTHPNTMGMTNETFHGIVNRMKARINSMERRKHAETRECVDV